MPRLLRWNVLFIVILRIACTYVGRDLSSRGAFGIPAREPSSTIFSFLHAILHVAGVSLCPNLPTNARHQAVR